MLENSYYPIGLIKIKYKIIKISNIIGVRFMSKRKSTLMTARGYEKRSIANYKKLEKEATKRDAIKVAKLFDKLGKDSEKRLKKIEDLIKRMKREKRQID